MASPEESSPFDPSLFTDPETGDFNNLLEFDRQTDELIASGNVETVLSFLADKVSGDDHRDSRLYRTFLLHLVERLDDPSAVQYHAANLAEASEQDDRYLEAATACRLVSSVHLEKGRLRDAAGWFTRMRGNLETSASGEEDYTLTALRPVFMRGILEYEGYYFLDLAARGKAKQARKDMQLFIETPVVPEERHHLASALAFLESDLGNNIAAMSALKKAENMAVEVGDYADASIYASRRTTQIMVVFGRMGVKGALDDAARYLEQGRQSGNDPEIIAKAKEQLEGRKELLK